MLNEVLYMEARLFREFCNMNNISPSHANDIFNKFQIWKYIESCYDTLHTTGDEYILDDIQNILAAKGAVI